MGTPVHTLAAIRCSRFGGVELQQQLFGKAARTSGDGLPLGELACSAPVCGVWVEPQGYGSVQARAGVATVVDAQPSTSMACRHDDCVVDENGFFFQ